ncbi:MAG: phosphoglycerate mutase (2,3-diphosphoglycerate-independent) [Myxococcales bacterium]|nr:phosphoglycerate mutase (2,3-diphosphoglycerate-independent) [Myxococcales bacterium]
MNTLQLQRARKSYLNGPLVTVVMDGVGLSDFQDDNALYLAKTPTLDSIFKEYGVVPLTAHGRSVGLPSDGDMGNSEVGHNALGAGRVFEQGASLVQTAIDSAQLYEGDTWRWLIEGALNEQQSFHWIGLLSDGNVHSHEGHLHAMLKQAASEGVKRGRVHILLDGRDVSERSALIYVERLEAVLADINASSGFDYKIASGGGRMTTTMDRYEADWAMVERGWATHVLGQAEQFPTAKAAILGIRANQPDLIDQFFPTFVIADEKGPVGQIKTGDSVCFFNFRGDRAIEISQAFEDRNFNAFERQAIDVRYAGMMQYDGDLKLPNRFLVKPPKIDRSLGAHLAYNGLKQFACSETQKYGHVTYFWNGNRSGYFDESLEYYQEIPSDLVPFEQRPWMKAAEITDVTLAHLSQQQCDFARINYANGDMVGHTGDLHSTIISIEALDLALGRLLRGVQRLGGAVLVTSDHGNAEQMFERDKKSGAPKYNDHGQVKALTSHTLNQVPLCLFDPLNQCPKLVQNTEQDLGLANLAATTLEILGLVPPDDYAFSLLRRD